MVHDWEKSKGPIFPLGKSTVVYVWACKNCGFTEVSSTKPYPQDIVTDPEGNEVLSEQCCEEHIAAEVHEQ